MGFAGGKTFCLMEGTRQGPAADGQGRGDQWPALSGDPWRGRTQARKMIEPERSPQGHHGHRLPPGRGGSTKKNSQVRGGGPPQGALKGWRGDVLGISFFFFFFPGGTTAFLRAFEDGGPAGATWLIRFKTHITDKAPTAPPSSNNGLVFRGGSRSGGGGPQGAGRPAGGPLCAYRPFQRRKPFRAPATTPQLFREPQENTPECVGRGPGGQPPVKHRSSIPF